MSSDCWALTFESGVACVAAATQRRPTLQSFFASQSLHNRKKFKKKSGDVNDEVKFPFFFLLHKRAKPYTGAHPCEGIGHADT